MKLNQETFPCNVSCHASLLNILQIWHTYLTNETLSNNAETSDFFCDLNHGLYSKNSCLGLCCRLGIQQTDLVCLICF